MAVLNEVSIDGKFDLKSLSGALQTSSRRAGSCAFVVTVSAN